MKLFLSFLFLIMAQSIAWIQMFGQFRWPQLFQGKIWIPIICSIPITLLFMLGANYAKEFFDGKAWPIRMITFSTGIIVFMAMSKIFLNESVDLKNIICIFLAIIIVLIQIFWN